MAPHLGCLAILVNYNWLLLLTELGIRRRCSRSWALVCGPKAPVLTLGPSLLRQTRVWASEVFLAMPNPPVNGSISALQSSGRPQTVQARSQARARVLPSPVW
jgi:hypothetical protein